MNQHSNSVLMETHTTKELPAPTDECEEHDGDIGKLGGGTRRKPISKE